MAVQERRTRYWEWRCDGPECESVGRQFTKTEAMPGWLAAKVTTSTVKAFCSRRCFERWMESLVAPAVEAGLPEAPAEAAGPWEGRTASDV